MFGHGLRIAIHRHCSLFPEIVIFELAVMRVKYRSIELHKSQTMIETFLEALFLNVAILDAILSDFDRDGFLSCWRIKLEIFVEALVLLTVDIIGSCDNEV